MEDKTVQEIAKMARVMSISNIGQCQHRRNGEICLLDRVEPKVRGVYCNDCKRAELAVKAGFRSIETIKQIGEQIKMAFYYEFDELIPSIMADKIDEIIKEYTEIKSE